jgi:hypothetical protein
MVVFQRPWANCIVMNLRRRSAKKLSITRVGHALHKQEKRRNLLSEIHRLARDLLHIQPTEEIGEDDAHLVPGEVDADAGVLAGGERVVCILTVVARLSVFVHVGSGRV